MPTTKPAPLISKGDASYVFWPETEYRCSDQCTQLKSETQCAKFGALIKIDAPAGSCDYYEHGGKTEWDMPVTGCLTKESAGYAENPSRQGFGCKRCMFFDAKELDCYRGIDKDSPGPTPGMIHPNACCNFNDPDSVRGKMSREELETLFASRGFTEAAKLLSASTLSPGVKVLAFKLQEALMHSDVSARLSDAVNDAHRGTGQYGYYITHDGDGESGNCIYSCNGDIRSAPYELGTRNGKATANIDMENSKNVVPVTTYQEEAEDGDHYTSMDESYRKDELYLSLPVYERFIPAATRKAADSGSFAGKGRSFPILKAEDVSAALHSIGRAGPGNYTSDTLRSNIKRIAKAKGFALPDSLKDDDDKKESISAAEPGVRLVESVAFLGEVKLAEASSPTGYPIKLIQPGRGSSGYYTPEVLKRDGPGIFTAGTQMFWNHATEAEEAARPEGDMDKLAAVLTSNAYYDESGKAGPGLYANAKVMADYADRVAEKAKYTGLSIRARGHYAESKTAPDGKPGLIAKLSAADSVDFVTKAGAGGKVLVESARPGQGDDMDKAEMQALIESAVKAAVAPLQAEANKLKETIALQAAPRMIHESLAELRLPAASKKKIYERLTGENVLAMLPMKEGKVDAEALTKLVEKEAEREAAFLMELGYGDSIPARGTRMTEAEIKAEADHANEECERVMEGLAEIFVGPKLPKGNADRDARKIARNAFREGRAA